MKFSLLLYIIYGYSHVHAVDFTIKNCDIGDGVSGEGSHSVFKDGSSNQNDCRAVSDLSLPVDTDYVIDVEFQCVSGSSPAIIYNIIDDRNYDVVYFSCGSPYCLGGASMIGGGYVDGGESYCNGKVIDEGDWFEVKLKQSTSGVQITLDAEVFTGFASYFNPHPSAGLMQALMFKSLCQMSCEFNFRSIKLSPDSIPEHHNTERGELKNPQNAPQNQLSVQRLEFYLLDRIPGTYCFIAFYFEAIDIGPATIYIQDDSDFQQGQVRIYSTSAANLDVFFFSSTMPPSGRYIIQYHVFGCGVPDNDLSFVCEEGRFYNRNTDFYRSTTYTSTLDNSDDALVTGWYGFSSCAGDKIPLRSLESENVCGTHNPIWLQASNGINPIGFTEASACVYKVGNDCSSTWTTPVFGCNNEHLLYYLVPTPAQSGYCAGHRLLCDPTKNLTSIDGSGCDPCIEADFPFLSDPPTIGEWEPDEDPGVFKIACNVKDPPNNVVDIEYVVEWYVEYGTHRRFLYDEGPSIKKEYFLQNRLIRRDDLQNHITCQAMGKYVGGIVNGPTAVSEPKFIGIQAQDTHLVQGVAFQKMFFKFTMPISCDDGNCDNDCSLDVVTVFSNRDLTRHLCINTIYLEPIFVTHGGCSVEVKCSEWDKEHELTIDVKDTKLFDERFSGYIHNVHFIAKDNRHMWNNLETTAKVSIETDQGTGGSFKPKCTSRNDPHITTYYGSEYDAHVPSEFVFYKSKPDDDPSMEVMVTSSFERCNRDGVMCHRAIGVRVQNEIVIVDPRGNPSHSYIGPGHGADGFKLTAHDNYEVYKLYLPKGEEIIVTRQNYDNALWLHLVMYAVTDPQHISVRNKGNGLCGQTVSAPCGDLIFRSGLCFEDLNTRWQNISEFYMDWRADPEKGEDIITNGNLNALNITDYLDTYSCSVYDINDVRVSDNWEFKRDLPTETCVTRSNDNLLDILRAEARSGQRSSSKRTAITLSDPVSRMGNIVEKNTESWTQNAAEQYCHTFIAESSIGKACNGIDPKDVERAVSECAADIKLTNETGFAQGTLNTLREICIEALYSNLSLITIETDGNKSELVLPSEIIDNLCSNECSGNGVCIKGECSCNDGFIKYDCSLSVTEPPQLIEVFGGSICHTNDCSYVTILGMDFVDDDNLTCHYIQQDSKQTIKGSMSNWNLVACSLPTVENSPAGYTLYSLTVSNDGVHTGDVLPVVLVQSPCVQCQYDNENEVACHVEKNMCHISGQCVGEGDTLASDVCQQCDPSVSQDKWTNINGCGGSGGLEPLHIGLIAVACICAVTGVLIVSVIIAKKSKQKIEPSEENESSSEIIRKGYHR